MTAGPQAPAKMPQAPAKMSSEHTVDLARMQASAKALATTPGYRFSATVTIEPEVLVANAPEGMSSGKVVVNPVAMTHGEPVTIKLDGEFSQSCPLHLKGAKMDAYRDGSRVAFTDQNSLWQIQTASPGSPGIADDQMAKATEGRAKDRVKAWEFWALYNLPAPHELLGHPGTQQASFQRSVNDRGLFSADDYVYSTILEGKAIPACCLSVLGDADGLICTLRIITDAAGAIKRVELQSTQKSSAKDAVAKHDAGEMKMHDFTVSYTLRDIGEVVKLEMPQAAQLRLEM
jgi:hypothetical protein